MFPPISHRIRCFLLLVVALFLSNRAFADSAVVFNEIQYHPTTGGSEWVELHSLHGVNVDMSGWKLAGGIDYTFPNGTTISGRGFIVVAANPSLVPGSIGPFVGQLKNGGDTIRLLNKNGRLMEEVSYSDGGGWPVGPDGSGATLVKLNQESAAANSSKWTTSYQTGGSPNATNFPSPGQPPTVTTLVDLAATWKYKDDNVAQAAGWTAIGFDDSGWSSGAGLLYAGTPNVTGAGEGLYGYWPLQENSGTSAQNLATGGTAATLVGGAAFATDATRGQVLNLPGTAGSYADAGTIPQLTLTNDFTWSFWANSGETATSTVVVGNRYNSSGVDSSPREFTKFTPSAFEYHRNTIGENVDYTDFPVGAWVHHAIVKTGSSLAYYRNGVLSNSLGITLGQNAAQPFYFGGDKGGENWIGKLDDIAVWTKALPASSIAGLASGSLNPQTAPTGSAPAPLTTQVTAGPRTHYFRRSFTYNGAKDRTTLTLQHIVDDGAVFYLNGAEILRVNMPGGAVTHDTAASSNIGGSSLSAAVTVPKDALVSGTNVLSVEVHQFSTTAPDSDMVFGAKLIASETAAPSRYPGTGLVFNEISAAGTGFQLELRNLGSTNVDLAGYKVVSSSGLTATLTAQTVPAGGVAVITAAQLGFTPASGDALFLMQPDATQFEDAQRVTGKLRGRDDQGRWIFPSAATFGSANTFNFNTSVVINELMYNPQVGPEKWVELYNRGASSVDMSGWKFGEGINFTFPPGTTLAAGQYLVITDDTVSFGQRYPGVTAMGPFTGSLSGRGEELILEDSSGNPVDTVRYADGGRWPEAADGGGSSLERRDVRADSNAPETWAASNEAARGSWQNFTWTGVAANLNGDPTQWNEFVFGLLGAGTFLIDDISVKDVTGGSVELIQNGGFETNGTTAWRLIGTHRNATVIDDPSGTGKVLRVIASDATEHMHNQCSTTLKNGASYVTIDAARTYTISFRARWVSGSNKLNVRLYFNRLAKTVLLPMTSGGGTPGAANSVAVANIGPTYTGLTHSPAVPPIGQPATVSVTPADPDGIGALTLFYSVNGGGFTSTAMTANNGKYSGTIPGQSSGIKVQFYVQATDSTGAISTFPAKGAASRAMIIWNDGQARLTQNGVSPSNLRIVMTPADIAFLHLSTNVMSNDRLGCTVIYNESEIYYDCGIKLKGSERGRNQPLRVSFNLRFPSENLFRGIHNSIAIDRSGAGVQFSQKEIMIKRAITGAGGIPGSEDDLCRVIAPQSAQTGPAILVNERYDPAYLDSQYPNGSDGRSFKFEFIYYPTTTSGNVESLKVPEPDSVVTSVTMRNLGPDKELHRWHWLIENQEEADDYTDLMTWLSAFGRSGTSDSLYISDTNRLMDVDEWLRSFAIEMLFGIGDNYGGGTSMHNAIVYQRPTDKRWMFFPHDMDFTFNNGTTSSLTNNPDLTKLIAANNPTNLRAYYGHLYNLCNTVYSTSYLLPWAQHYNKFVSEDLTQYMSYIDARRTYALSTVNSAVPSTTFKITTNSGQPYTVSTPFVTLQGTGWVNVREIRIAGSTQPLAVTWLSSTVWQVAVPVASGTQTVTLEAVGFDGAVLSTTSIVVTNTGTNTWAPLAINEWLASNSSFVDPADGGTDDWLELYNPTGAAVSLGSWTISDDTVTYVIPSGYWVPANGSLVVWADDQTYENTGSGQLHVPFSLSASGDALTLRSPDGQLIDKITFGVQERDISEGRYPDGGALRGALTLPTPGTKNIYTVPVVQITGNVVSLSFTTTPGAKYQAEVSADLITWQNLGTQQTAAGSTITVEETQPAGIVGTRYYRVRVQP